MYLDCTALKLLYKKLHFTVFSCLFSKTSPQASWNQSTQWLAWSVRQHLHLSTMYTDNIKTQYVTICIVFVNQLQWIQPLIFTLSTKKAPWFAVSFFPASVLWPLSQKGSQIPELMMRLTLHDTSCLLPQMQSQRLQGWCSVNQYHVISASEASFQLSKQTGKKDAVWTTWCKAAYWVDLADWRAGCLMAWWLLTLMPY